MRSIRIAGLLGLIALTAAAGCGGPAHLPTPPAAPPPTTPSPTLPPRPIEMRVDGVDPCALLTDAQRGQLGVNPGQSSKTYAGPLQGPVCVWTNLPKSPDNAYAGGAILNHGAEYALGLEPIRSVAGFAATTTGSTGTDPNWFCLMLVDVAPGQSMSAQYANDSHDYPGMNHQLACDKAQQLASDMLSTLRTIKQR